ncbi:uncharacterized protein LOC121906406 [Thunnus maccoyii]|uniref:uncharacterized protein LOC121906406 n=1 Tax=Thunnus maccoyii TaxID=8240 RepID=UPI001C4D42B6|nr:uncharacterized protein LOC121906406 [Thunnus maccoyii]
MQEWTQTQRPECRYDEKLFNCGQSRTGTFVLNVTETSYQAEENDNITLEWMFTTKTDSSSTSLNIYCELLTDVKPLVLYYLYEGVEVSEFQDGQFAGRVQCDIDALREGRIRLHVSRIRTDDSGLYVCEVRTNYGGNTGKGRLNVTAARDWPEPERPNTASRERIGLYCVLGLTAAAISVLAVYSFTLCLLNKIYTRSSDGFQKTYSSADGSEETV